METSNQKGSRSLRHKLNNLHSKKKRLLALIAITVIAGVGTWILGTSMASSPVTPSIADSQCGARVKNYTYKVPFGNAPWNVPVCKLPRHQRSTEYASRIFNYGVQNDGSAAHASRRGNFHVKFGFEDPRANYTRAVYYASDATTTKKVQTCANNCGMTNFDDNAITGTSSKRWLPDREVPWNPKWQIAGGGDNELIIIDDREGLPTSGQLFSFSSVKEGLEAFTQCFPWQQDRLCASSAKILRDYDGKVADYRTFEGSDFSRGAGINYFATLVTPEEVAAGEIRHALGMGVFNTAFGPRCTAEQLAKNDPKVIDVTCGTAVAPAAKYEWGNVSSIGERLPKLKGTTVDSAYTLRQTVPEGMRFALDIDDAYIENWINSRDDLKSNPRKAETARIFARAMRDYGFMPVDTSGFGAGIQVAGALNEEAKQQWNDLGITNEKDDYFLNGLVSSANIIYTVEPPVNNCIDGRKSQFYCEYTASKYNETTSGTPVADPLTNNPDDGTTDDDPPSDPPTVPEEPVVEPPKPPLTTNPRPVTIDDRIPVTIQWNSKKFELHQAADVRWSASESPHGIDRYVVRKNGLKVYEGPARKYTDFEINNGTAYLYSVQAIDKKGNRSSVSEYRGLVKCGVLNLSCEFVKILNVTPIK